MRPTDASGMEKQRWLWLDFPLQGYRKMLRSAYIVKLCKFIFCVIVFERTYGMCSIYFYVHLKWPGFF